MGELNKLRTNIDKIDDNIIELLKKRFILAKKISDIKCRSKIRINNKKREKQIIKILINKHKYMNKNFICKLYKMIFKYSRNIQKKSK